MARRPQPPTKEEVKAIIEHFKERGIEITEYTARLQIKTLVYLREKENAKKAKEGNTEPS